MPQHNTPEHPTQGGLEVIVGDPGSGSLMHALNLALALHARGDTAQVVYDPHMTYTTALGRLATALNDGTIHFQWLEREGTGWVDRGPTLLPGHTYAVTPPSDDPWSALDEALQWAADADAPTVLTIHVPLDVTPDALAAFLALPGLSTVGLRLLMPYRLLAALDDCLVDTWWAGYAESDASDLEQTFGAPIAQHLPERGTAQFLHWTSADPDPKRYHTPLGATAAAAFGANPDALPGDDPEE